MLTTARALAQNRVNTKVITIDADHDFELGRYRDRDYFRWPRGHRVRLGLPGEYVGVLAIGTLPPRGHSLPRCIVVCQQIENRIERAFMQR